MQRPTFQEFKRALIAVTAPAVLLIPRLGAQVERGVTTVADGVYEIQHRDHHTGLLAGNTTVIIGDRQVFVVDAGFAPSEVREDIAQIRQWTTKPVAFVLNTHFHNDHNLGNRFYMEAFPSVTIVAQTETKKEMDRFGPTLVARTAETTARYQKMLKDGNDGAGHPLGAGDSAELNRILPERLEVGEELRGFVFQSATLTFDDELVVDIGNRVVEVKFLGRGNTAGDAVVFLPKERVAMVGDLVVYPIPYFYDGYPTEWAQTLDRVAQLDPLTIIPGHGPVMHDKTYLLLVRDLIRSAVEQFNAAQGTVGMALNHSPEEFAAKIDLSRFRESFAGNDEGRQAAFDSAVSHLITLVFREISVR